MARRNNVRSRPRRTRRRISRRVRRGGAELKPKPPGADGFGTFGEVTPASNDTNDAPPTEREHVMGVDQPPAPEDGNNSDGNNSDGFIDLSPATPATPENPENLETPPEDDSDSDGFVDLGKETYEKQPAPAQPVLPQPAPEQPAPEPGMEFKPSGPGLFGKVEKPEPLFKDIEPPPEAAPAALPAMPPAAPAAFPAMPPAVPMPPDDFMERPRDAYLMGEQKIATRFPDFGKRKPRRMRRPTKKKRRVTKAQTLRKQITKKARELKSLRKKLSKRRSKKLTKKTRKRLTKQMNDIKRRLGN